MIINDPFESIAETFDWINTFRGDIPFWINQAKRNGGPILELGCGTGRTVWSIADVGVPVVGIDFSMAMLKIAESKRKFHQEAASVILKLADVRDFNLGIKFNTIIMPGRSFEQILTEADQIQLFKTGFKHLHQHGNLVLFTMAPPDPTRPEGVEYLHKTLINPNTNNTCRLYRTNTNNYRSQVRTIKQRLEEIESDGHVMREWHYPPIQLRWSTASQLTVLGKQMNFQIVARFSDWLRRPYREGDNCLIYVYQK